MHRLYLIAVFSILYMTGICQINEDFTSSDLSAWSGDVNQFTVNNNGELQLNSSEAGEAGIFTNVNFPDSLSWECDISLEFSPSNNNQLTVLLATDSPDTDIANGYILKIGESGSDDAIELYQLIDGDEEIIGRGIDGKVANAFDIKINLTKDINDDWILSCSDNDNPGSTLQFQINYTDNIVSQMSIFGFVCKYSGSNVQNFRFDNLVIEEITPDTEGPEVVQVNVLSDTQIEVIFNEALAENTAVEFLNYRVNNNTIIDFQFNGVTKDRVTLTLANPLNGCSENSFDIMNVRDVVGNVMLPFNTNVSVEAIPGVGDLLINELLADPVSGQFDFVEIINPTNKTFSLKGLILRNEFKDEERAIEEDILIGPGEIYAFTKGVAETETFYDTPPEANINTLNIPSFNISDGNVSLIYETLLGGRIYLDSFDYFNTFHDPALPITKGFSLERISLISDSNNASTWSSASETIGASPGYGNSIAENPFKKISAKIISEDQIEVKFLTGPSAASKDINSYFINNGASIIDVESVGTNNKTIHLFLQSPLQSGEIYNLSVSVIEGECGEAFEDETIDLFLLEEVEEGDLLLTEVLFDSAEEPQDFIEIINTTEKYLSLENIYLFNDTRSENPILITALPYLSPNQIVAFSEDPAAVINQYNPPTEANIVTQKVPTLNQSDGNISLQKISILTQTLDSYDYEESFHWQALAETKAVSLERINIDRSILGNEAQWNSSASTNNFATPGYKNSAAVEPGNLSDEIISLESKVFSPDSDGFKDVLLINYKLDKPGYFGSMNIYDDRGRQEVELINNKSFATSGTLKWDGTLANNVIAPIGIYIIHYKFFHPDGDTLEGKKVCVLAKQLN